MPDDAPSAPSPRAASRAPLPALAFGRRAAFEFRDAAALSEALSSNGSAQVEYRSSGDDAFRSLTSVLRTANTQIVANSMSSTRFRCTHGAGEGGLFLIPFQGSGTTRTERRDLAWRRGRKALYLTSAGSEGESTERGAIGIHAPPETLNALARSMAGIEDLDVRPLRLHEPRSLELDLAGVNFDQVFHQKMQLLDAFGDDEAGIERSGLEDAILRSLVMLSAPHLFFGERAGARSRSPSRQALDRLCDHVESHLEARITLTQMERLSGLSARSLQYGFREAFDRTPMQWVEDRRLDKVRENLLGGSGGQSVSAIARRYFPHLGDFSRRYQARFGELPSQTLRRR